jgi:hypothetical protein
MTDERGLRPLDLLAAGAGLVEGGIHAALVLGGADDEQWGQALKARRARCSSGSSNRVDGRPADGAADHS